MPFKDPEKAKEYHKKYYEKNKEKRKEYIKNWKKENPEKVREHKKKWEKENKEKRREQGKKWKEENKEQIKEYMKKWREENKEQIKEYNKNWEKENREKVKEWQRKWREENREHLRGYHKKWREENPEYKKNWQKEKYHTDPCYKLRRLTARVVNAALKEGKGGKSMLPYVDWNSYEELKAHLESQFEDWMTWENHGMWHPTERRWHIDHIKPQSVLLEGVTSMDDPKFRECWALENLRPLEARENIIKGNKIL